MGNLIYSTFTSLDGYIEDADGGIDWGQPDEEVFTFVNAFERSISTYLYGRRLYEAMVYWETAHTAADQTAVVRDFAVLWQAADKIVYSKTLQAAMSARTRIERSFDADAVRRLKETAGTDITVGGANLAAQALQAGLVDELHLFVVPITVGGGKPALPGQVRLNLDLQVERRFTSGVVYLRYGIRPLGRTDRDSGLS
jgi:dihydrofolate reductase